MRAIREDYLGNRWAQLLVAMPVPPRADDQKTRLLISRRIWAVLLTLSGKRIRKRHGSAADALATQTFPETENFLKNQFVRKTATETILIQTIPVKPSEID